MISAATSTTVRIVASSASNNNKVRVIDTCSSIQSREENRIFLFLFWINFSNRALLLRGSLSLSLSFLSQKGEVVLFSLFSLSREDSLPYIVVFFSLSIALLFGIVFERERA